ncbi:MAG: hypothetical protein NTV10_07270 [Methanoregula sp.]|jgi:hypothetical protein|nr:hypothetical protein [Methanoregula sp.]
MSVSRCLLLLAVVFLITLSAGCMSLAVGDVSYRNQQGLVVHVSNSGDPVDAGIQVRIYEIKDLNQRELTVTGIPVSVKEGENEFSLPVLLEPGTYKLYVYVTVNGERRTASIKDLVI